MHKSETLIYCLNVDLLVLVSAELSYKLLKCLKLPGIRVSV